MIKAIIFDCFGVLTADLWREFVDHLPPEADAVKARELNHQYDAGLITIQEFLDKVEVATGERPHEVEKLLDNEVTKNIKLLDYIRELKATYRIGMISNIGTNWITEKFLTKEEQGLFDAMTLSFEAGTTKPDPRIYKEACEQLGVAPEEALFIDDIADYCEAARAIGMKAIHYQNFKQTKADTEHVLNHT